MGVHLDPSVVFQKNKSVEGKRKNGCLINTGGKKPMITANVKTIQHQKKEEGKSKKI